MASTPALVQDFFFIEKRVVTSKNMIRNEVNIKIYFVTPKIGKKCVVDHESEKK